MIDKTELVDKYILDACCSVKAMWYNKNHPNAVYIEEIRKAEQLPNFDYDIFEEITGISKEDFDRKLGRINTERKDNKPKIIKIDGVRLTDIEALKAMLLFNFPKHEDKRKIREVWDKWIYICETKNDKEEPIKFKAFDAARKMALKKNGYSKEFIKKFGLDKGLVEGLSINSIKYLLKRLFGDNGRY